MEFIPAHLLIDHQSCTYNLNSSISNIPKGALKQVTDGALELAKETVTGGLDNLVSSEGRSLNQIGDTNEDINNLPEEQVKDTIKETDEDIS